MSFRQDPGDCPVCGQSHSACTPADSVNQILIAQTPARDEMPRVPTHDETLAAAKALNPAATSTKTYRGQKK